MNANRRGVFGTGSNIQSLWRTQCASRAAAILSTAIRADARRTTARSLYSTGDSSGDFGRTSNCRPLRARLPM